MTKTKILLHITAFVALFSPNLFAADDQLTEGMVNPGYHEKPLWFKESFLDIREDIAEATAADKRVLLYFYQDGCPYCGKLLKDNFGDSKIADYTLEKFDVIAINMWGDREVVSIEGNSTTEKAFARTLKVQFTPTMLFLDENGKVLFRINGYFAPYKFMTALQYVGEKLENQLSARDYFIQQAPEAASGQLHIKHSTMQASSGVLNLQRQSPDKPLLVSFEQKVCKACDELHLDILERDKLKPSLEKFDVVVLDSLSKETVITPDGKSMPIDEWAAQLSIAYSPSLLFFDTSNQQVFRTGGYMKSFHTQAALDYVSERAYLEYPEFQRFVQKIADDLHDRGIAYDLME